MSTVEVTSSINICHCPVVSFSARLVIKAKTINNRLPMISIVYGSPTAGSPNNLNLKFEIIIYKSNF
jgi:hypothetical protein